jgi:hypothetical protein
MAPSASRLHTTPGRHYVAGPIYVHPELGAGKSKRRWYEVHGDFTRNPAVHVPVARQEEHSNAGLAQQGEDLSGDRRSALLPHSRLVCPMILGFSGEALH